MNFDADPPNRFCSLIPVGFHLAVLIKAKSGQYIDLVQDFFNDFINFSENSRVIFII